MQRIVLFLLTNLAIMVVLSITMSILMSVFGIDRQGMGGLLVMASVFGIANVEVDGKAFSGGLCH